MAAGRRSATGTRHRSPGRRLEGWVTQVWRAQRLSARQFTRSPLGSLLTAAVLGVVLALPACFWVALNNMQQLLAPWSDRHEINVFLEIDVPVAEAEALSQRLLVRPDVERVQLIDRAAALEEFKRYSGIADTLEVLEENPLPTVIMVYPRAALSEVEHEAMLLQLRGLSGVDGVRFDRQWAMRLGGLVELSRQTVLLVAALLAITVLLIVVNTTRLEVSSRREEIRISLLFGASSTFVRRPFLYAGLWLGTVGGALAWLLTVGVMAMLQQPAAALAVAYGSSFRLSGPDPGTGLALLAIGALLGLLGAALAVRRHLRALTL